MAVVPELKGAGGSITYLPVATPQGEEPAFHEFRSANDSSSGGYLRAIAFESFRVAVMPPANEPRPYPERLYVAIPGIAKGIGSVVFLVAVFSLVMSAAENFDMIHPFVAILVAIGSAAFYLMGRATERKYKKK
jgi:hypothetical protein